MRGSGPGCRRWLNASGSFSMSPDRTDRWTARRRSRFITVLRSTSSRDRHQRRTGDHPGPVPVGCSSSRNSVTTAPYECPAPPAECRDVRSRPARSAARPARSCPRGCRLPALAGGVSVAELVDGPQVDPGGVRARMPYRSYRPVCSPKPCRKTTAARGSTAGPVPVVDAAAAWSRNGMRSTAPGLASVIRSYAHWRAKPCSRPAQRLVDVGRRARRRTAARTNRPCTVSKSMPGAIARPVSASSVSQNPSESEVKSETSA